MEAKEKKNPKKSSAVSAIIEIVVVIAILAILAAIFVPKYKELNEKLDAAAEAQKQNSLAAAMLASLIGGENTTPDVLIIAESGENIRVYAYDSADRAVYEYKKSPIKRDNAKTFDAQKDDILKALAAEGCIKENNIAADSWKTEANTKAIAESLDLKGERAIYANYTLNADNFAPVDSSAK